MAGRQAPARRARVDPAAARDGQAPGVRDEQLEQVQASVRAQVRNAGHHRGERRGLLRRVRRRRLPQDATTRGQSHGHRRARHRRRAQRDVHRGRPRRLQRGAVHGDGLGGARHRPRLRRRHRRARYLVHVRQARVRFVSHSTRREVRCDQPGRGRRHRAWFNAGRWGHRGGGGEGVRGGAGDLRREAVRLSVGAAQGEPRGHDEDARGWRQARYRYRVWPSGRRGGDGVDADRRVRPRGRGRGDGGQRGRRHPGPHRAEPAAHARAEPGGRRGD